MGLCRFERELRTKLSQKATVHSTEETTLLKAFKYFDLDGNGKSYLLLLGAFPNKQST